MKIHNNKSVYYSTPLVKEPASDNVLIIIEEN